MSKAAKVARLAREREGLEALIIAEQAVKEVNISSEKAVATREIQRKRELDIANQEARIAVAKRSEELSKADDAAAAAAARAIMVNAEEQVHQGARDRRSQGRRGPRFRAPHPGAGRRRPRAHHRRGGRQELRGRGRRSAGDNEAKNLPGEAIMAFAVRKDLVAKREQVIATAMKPAEKIESVRMLHTISRSVVTKLDDRDL